eukprot:g17947.t1
MIMKNDGGRRQGGFFRVKEVVKRKTGGMVASNTSGPSLENGNNKHQRAEDRCLGGQGMVRGKETPVVCIDTGEFYPSVTIAAKALGVKRENIFRSVAGDGHYRAEGRRWRKATKQDIEEWLASTEGASL